jgi:hypothetical protein
VPSSRAEVFRVLNIELDFIDANRNALRRPVPLAEGIVDIREIANQLAIFPPEALDDPEAKKAALHLVRSVAAVSIRTMQEHGMMPVGPQATLASLKKLPAPPGRVPSGWSGLASDGTIKP